MACERQSRGLNSVQHFPEPCSCWQDGPPGVMPRGSRRDLRSSCLPGKQRLPGGCFPSRPSPLFFRNHPPRPQPSRLPEVEAGGCRSHSTNIVLLVTGFHNSVTRASRKDLRCCLLRFPSKVAETPSPYLVGFGPTQPTNLGPQQLLITCQARLCSIDISAEHLLLQEALLDHLPNPVRWLILL